MSRPKRSLVPLAIILIVGGLMIIRQGHVVEGFYQRLGADGGVSWPSIVGGLLIAGGAVLLLGKLLNSLDSGD